MVTRTRDAHEIAPTPPAKAKVNVLLVDDDATNSCSATSSLWFCSTCECRSWMVSKQPS